MIASEVTAQSAVLLNNAAQDFWTNTVLLPCLTKANEELEQIFEINEIPLQKQVSATIDVNIDAVIVALPTDFVEPISLRERPRDSTESWSEEIGEVALIDPNDTESTYIDQWCWRDNKVNINPPQSDREVLLTYVRKLTPLTAVGSTVEIPQAKTWLAARTAEIAARNVGNNPTKADELRDNDVAPALDLLIRRMVKKNQSLGVRRKPYKGRNRP
jgi:hypothetical protein